MCLHMFMKLNVIAYFGGTPSSTPGTGTIIPGTPMDDADEQYQYTTNRPFLQSQSQSQTQSQTLGSTPTTPRSNVGPTNAALRGNNFITGTPTSAATTPIIPRGDLGGNRPISHKRVHLTSEHIPGTPFTPYACLFFYIQYIMFFSSLSILI